MLPFLSTSSSKCFISCISYVLGPFWIFVVLPKHNQQLTVQFTSCQIILLTEHRQHWDEYVRCVISVLYIIHTYGTFFTQSYRAWFISCSKWLWGKWASSVCRILLTATWVLPLSPVKAVMPLQKPAIKFLFKRGLDFTTSYTNDCVSQSVTHQMRGCTTEAIWIPLEGQQAIQTHRAPIKGASRRVDKGNIYHLV